VLGKPASQQFAANRTCGAVPADFVQGMIIGLFRPESLSDLLHHFAVLPIIVGNTGWHWP